MVAIVITILAAKKKLFGRISEIAESLPVVKSTGSVLQVYSALGGSGCAARG
jgi:hypothetical protein